MTTSSRSAASSLQQLSKVALVPSRLSALAATRALLEKIDHVEINGVVYYEIDVFLRHNKSHLPTTKATTVADRPDYCLERRFSDFTSLRYQVWYHAQQQHGDQHQHQCTYCGDFMHFIVHAMSQPRLLVKLVTGVATRKRLLSAFCNAFLERSRGRSTDAQTCVGYAYIPHLVESFFRQDRA
jgi:hypothetical protein